MKRLIALCLIFALFPTVSSISASAESTTVEKDYSGKTVSILGDSISTFKGYVPEDDGTNLKHYYTYPSITLLKEVEQTWWMQTIRKLDAQLGINDSWSGTRVSNFTELNGGQTGRDVCMASVTRIKNLGSNGTPDLILFYGGTNDVGNKVELGKFDPATAPTQVDLEAVIWDDFAQAYTAAIMRLQHFYPNAEIYAMLPNRTLYFSDEKFAPYIEIMQAICDHYDVETIDLRDSGIQLSMLPDGVHPDIDGMQLISEKVVSSIMHTHTFIQQDDETYHLCSCGKAQSHRFVTSTGFLWSQSSICSICAFAFTNNTIPIILCSATAFVIVSGIIGSIIVLKKKRK